MLEDVYECVFEDVCVGGCLRMCVLGEGGGGAFEGVCVGGCLGLCVLKSV